MTSYLKRYCTLLLIWLCLGPASVRLLAHANLIRTEPGSGTILAQSPRQVRLEFSEGIEGDFNAIAVYNAHGIRMDAARAVADSADMPTLRLPLEELPSGTYTVVWHVVSDDGHPLEGAFGFVVGTATAGTQRTIVGPSPWRKILVPLAGLVHALAIVSMLLLAGLPLFYWLVFRPAAITVSSTEVRDTFSEAAMQPVILRALRAAAWFALAASTVSLLIQAVRVGGSVSVVATPSIFFRLVSRTRFGQMWLIRIAGLLVFSGLAAWIDRKGGRRLSVGRLLPLTLLSIFLLLTPGLAGHPAAAPGSTAVYLVIADWLHLLAAAPWVAGLGTFGFLLPALALADWRDQSRLTVSLIEHFPRIAVGSVALLVASGILAALEHVPSWQGLFGTTYGQTILAKSALLVPVLALAGGHHLFFKRRFQRLDGTGDLTEISHCLLRFRRVVLLELAFIGIILSAAGLLVNLPPAKVSLAAKAGKSFDESRDSQGLRLTLRIRPACVGLNSAEIEVSPLERAIDIDQLQPTLTAKMLTHDMGLQRIALKHVSSNRFRADDLMLGMSGPWQVGVMSALQDGREIQVSYRLLVPPTE